MVLVGEGPERHKIEQLIKRLSLSEQVTLTGVRDDVCDMMNLFDLFLFPSFYEELGIALIEAQASGLPCVASDTIPDEAIITKNVKQISLCESAEFWAAEMLSFVKLFKRKDESHCIKAANYDIATATERLCEFYLVHSK